MTDRGPWVTIPLLLTGNNVYPNRSSSNLSKIVRILSNLNKTYQFIRIKKSILHCTNNPDDLSVLYGRFVMGYYETRFVKIFGCTQLVCTENNTGLISFSRDSISLQPCILCYLKVK